MNHDNTKYSLLFKTFAHDVAEITTQFTVQKPILNNTGYAEIFAKNREEDAHADKSDYSKVALIKQERQNIKSKREKQMRRQRARREDPKGDQMQLNTMYGDQVREEKIQTHIRSQSTSRRQKDYQDLQKAQHINELKEKSYKGDQRAQKQLQNTMYDAAMRRIRGEKVRDDESKIKQSMKNDRRQKAKRDQRRDREESKERIGSAG